MKPWGKRYSEGQRGQAQPIGPSPAMPPYSDAAAAYYIMAADVQENVNFSQMSLEIRCAVLSPEKNHFFFW
jgi:hypothetical protein